MTMLFVNGSLIPVRDRAVGAVSLTAGGEVGVGTVVPQAWLRGALR